MVIWDDPFCHILLLLPVNPIMCCDRPLEIFSTEKLRNRSIQTMNVCRNRLIQNRDYDSHLH